MTTLDQISEQIQRIYVSSVDSENVSPMIDRREIYPLVIQLVNTELGAAHLKSRRLGEISIPACIMATYSNLPVVTADAIKYVELPVHPIRLSRDMGIWDVTPVNSSWGAGYISVPSGMIKLLGGLEESFLEGTVGYVYEGGKIRFVEFGATVADNVDVQLLVADYSEMLPTTILPLYADLEVLIIAKAVELLKTGGLRPNWQRRDELPEMPAQQQTQ
ncbi:MAG: hypothetical protein DRI46_06620 [Chloroflexi bacterium]|nr:MAG: hypothetical protein DRI46_06620 [Chloroflexota bacterium]